MNTCTVCQRAAPNSPASLIDADWSIFNKLWQSKLLTESSWASRMRQRGFFHTEPDTGLQGNKQWGNISVLLRSVMVCVYHLNVFQQGAFSLFNIWANCNYILCPWKSWPPRYVLRYSSCNQSFLYQPLFFINEVHKTDKKTSCAMLQRSGYRALTLEAPSKNI